LRLFFGVAGLLVHYLGFTFVSTRVRTFEFFEIHLTSQTLVPQP
jgi:hypothetical protein